MRSLPLASPFVNSPEEKKKVWEKKILRRNKVGQACLQHKQIRLYRGQVVLRPTCLQLVVLKYIRLQLVLKQNNRHLLPHEENQNFETAVYMFTVFAQALFVRRS